MARIFLLFFAFFLLANLFVARGQSAVSEEVVVTGGDDSTTPPDEAGKQRSETPGGFTIKNADDARHGRASNFDDLLQRTPGLFLQSENGSEVSKVSIRGSGIDVDDEPVGVMVLLDGLNYN